MTYVPLTEAKDKLSGLIDDALATHEIVHITKHGRPAAVLMAEDDLESLHDTIFWLSQPGLADSIRISSQDLADGMALDEVQLRERYGLQQ